ncbi:MAG: type I-U CRISPR-associated protein Cas7, partial [Verrucomicrobia bacterium]|nr:type I-U CRISPR-associated protein Cas7 [Verrucomicrobiota bacterium]
MPIDLAPLGDAHRLLLQVELQALQGSRFQPTGFPNLGPALYRGPGSDDLLLVESAQSMANRLEGVCWDEVADDWVKTLRGIPLVKVRDSAGRPMTNSVLDSHRLNSSYILDAQGQDGSNSPFVAIISERLSAIAPNGPVKIPELAKFVFCYCPNSLLHGVFFANRPHNERIGGGRLRLARVLSSFIEASGVRIAASGGVKIDRQDASGKTDGGSAETGYGNVPFPREEFTAESIIAYFNLDLAQLRGYGLGGA